MRSCSQNIIGARRDEDRTQRYRGRQWSVTVCGQRYRGRQWCVTVCVSLLYSLKHDLRLPYDFMRSSVTVSVLCCRVTVSVVWLLRSNLNTIQRVIVYQDVCSARPDVARHAEERDRAGVGRLAWGVATPLTQHTTLTRDRDRRHDTRCTRTSNEHRTLEPLVSAQDKSHPITSAQGSNPKIAPMLDLVALVSTRRRP